MSFSLNLPKLSYFGIGAVDDAIAALTQQPVKCAMIVTDKTLIQLGILNHLFELLEQTAIGYVLFDKVTPNPTATLVREGLEIYSKNECDCLIAVGGGSPVDCAKAIRILAANAGDIVDYEGVGKVKKTGDFFIAINTTAGTAAEMTSNSVITDEVRQVKMVIIDSKQIPDIAVNDPTLMLGLPPSITAATGMDALTHAIESYVTPGAHTLTRPTALEAIRLITQWLPEAVENGQNIEARTHLADAQFLAGMSFNNAGLGLVHAMAHQPGATHDLPHGVCNAILLPIVCAFNAASVPERYRGVAEAMGGDTSHLNDQEAAQLAVELIKKLSRKVEIPDGFRVLGVADQDIELWIDKAMNDVCLGGNPVTPSADEIRSLYREAL
ncbi:lactaldehyde dehydrogenase [Vibrio mimicus]|uniref:lactaldehyde reductase n=1 Tax=Vibrio mimicus TaxID=674 RepID=UPI0002B93D86|nr:lactaldehyde reductase [Vibrio mimicus]EMB49204.1 alcohol dehydrogenase [Vibrio mimicus CAIM 602]MBY7673667.1 lactaldehyde reductase [Vibrio mimicus]MBY7725520.1 lactaldehyde reductase [Vibrio mimicus]TXY31392.1 lactaldehyde reductase [Vibrio mimicus]SUQ22696.1 lactaldehyde dehydrogenase [Vibrio mimicus]